MTVVLPSVGDIRDWVLLIAAGTLAVSYAISNFGSGGSLALKQTREQLTALEDTSKAQSADIILLRAENAAMKLEMASIKKERDELKSQMTWQSVPPAVQSLVNEAATKNMEAATKTLEAISAQSGRIDHLVNTIDEFLADARKLLLILPTTN